MVVLKELARSAPRSQKPFMETVLHQHEEEACGSPAFEEPPALEDEDIGSDHSDSESEDENFVPEQKKRLKPRRRKIKKRRKRVPSPDMTELSLPKPQSRLDPDLTLGLAGSTCTYVADIDLGSTLGPKLPPSAPQAARVDLLEHAPRPTRGTDEDPMVAEYRAIYAKQLPGMPFYHDAAQALLSVEGVGGGDGGTDVVGGATFRMLEMTTSECSLLILDVLALAVNPDRAQRGIGSTLIHVLKAIASREAAARGAKRPLLLTQADLGCVGFWVKCGLVRALDANTLVRSLRRSSGHTIFTGATPMALVLPAPPKKKA